MKKLWCLVGILAMGTVLFAEGGTPAGNAEKKATMDVKAEVIKPLTVKSNGDINFGGNIIKGTYVVGNSSFAIEGEKSSQILISFDGAELGENGNYKVKLNSEETPDVLLSYFNATANTDSANNQYIDRNPIVTLGNDGKANINIAASMIANGAPGNYIGTFKLKALYQ